MDDWGWRRLIRIANDELEKFRLNFSRCTNRDIDPLSSIMREPQRRRQGQRLLIIEFLSVKIFAITNIPITIQFICRWCYTCSLLNVGLQAETQEIGGGGSCSLRYAKFDESCALLFASDGNELYAVKTQCTASIILFCSSNIFCVRTFFTCIFAECEQPLRENFCLNGGTCFRLPGEGPPTDPNCVCRTGYTGNRCQETVIDFRKSLVDDF